jgi:predicted RecB family nuclease
MNERTKELLEQAEILSHPEYEDEVLQNRRLYNEIFLSKFAELIVRECAMVIEKNLYKNIGWSTSRAVKRHFGIEDEE